MPYLDHANIHSIMHKLYFGNHNSLTFRLPRFGKFNKQLLDEVFVICRIINVEVRVISRAEGVDDSSFRDIDNFAYHKNQVQ